MGQVIASPLFRNLLAAGGGAAAGQMVAVAFAPLITRLYSPEVFGLQGLFLSLVSLLSPAIALRYPMAIVIAADDAEAHHIALLAAGIAFGLSCLLGLMLLVLQGPILMLPGAQALGPLIWFLPLAVFCVALQNVAEFRAARLGRFGRMGAASVAQSFIANLARVLGGLFAPVAGILVAITALAPALHAALLAQRPGAARAPINWRESAALLRRYRDFPIYRVPTDMLNSATQSVPVILLAMLHSPAAAGFYVLARSVVNLPSNIIGAAVGNVLYARFAELARQNRPLWPMLMRATLALMALAPVIIALAWRAPDAFAALFGENWREAGDYARWIAIWVAMMIANVPTTRIVPVIGFQNLQLAYNIALLGLGIAAVLLATRLSPDPETAVIAFTACCTGMILLGLIVFAGCTRHFDRAQARAGRAARTPRPIAPAPWQTGAERGA